MDARVSNALSLAHWVFDVEKAALEATAAALDQGFADIVDFIHDRVPPAKVIVTGVGKSGHIGRKIAATLSSTGTPAAFMHPAEAAHGDLGLIGPGDVVLGLSHSGESAELLALVPFFKRQGIPLLAMTGAPESSLARASQGTLLVVAAQEACPLGLAPTSSTTAALALGDALAVALLSRRGFGRADFALTHPAGALGRRLLLRVADVMLAVPDAPAVAPHTTVRDAIVEMNRGGIGLTAVVAADGSGHLLGVFTDGDLRRCLDRNSDIYGTPIADSMSRHPATVVHDDLAVNATNQMQARKANAILVVDADGRYRGALNWRMLLAAKVV